MKLKLAAALATFAAMGVAQAALPPAVVFVGYCDGMAFTNAGGGFVTGSSTGCLSDPIHGVTAKVKGGQGLSYVVTGYGVVLGGMGLTFIVRENGTWYIEKADGSGEVVNEGTWVLPTEGAGPRSGRPAGAR